MGRPRELFNSSTGAQLVSSAVSTTNHLPLFQVAILPVSKELYAWFPTPLLLPRPFLVLITSSILCTPREPSSTGTSVRVWRRVNSPRPVRILLPLRRITKRLVPKLPKVKVRKRTSERNINSMVLNMPTRYPVVITDFTSVLSLIAAAVFFSSHLAGRSVINCTSRCATFQLSSYLNVYQLSPVNASTCVGRYFY